jgi:thiamine biosynthesis protein ThiI
VLSRVPGVISYSWAEVMDYENVKEYLAEQLKKFHPGTFKVEAHRVDKSFPMTSPEINSDIGAFVADNFGWKVKLDKPEMRIYIEIIGGKSYVFFDKVPGVGGLPVGSAGKLLLLISPGMDSPVAGYMMLRRGAELTALHFSQGPVGLKKVKQYVELLNSYSPRDIELVVIDHREMFGKYANALKRVKREEWTCVFCKYVMLKEAERISKEKGALGIVTGDSLGQVASQTLNNMMVESMGLSIPVYRPLIGMDKVDIERIARDTGSLSIFLSAKEENCPFRPRHVVTEAEPSKFRKIMKLSEP